MAIQNIYWRIIVETYQSAVNHNVFRHAAAMSFYAIVSLAPLLALFLSVVSSRQDPQKMSRRLVEDIEHFVGPAAADAAETIVRHVGAPAPDHLSIVLGAVVLLVGATAMFTQLQDSLNLIWETRTRISHYVWAFVRRRLISLLMIVVVAMLLLVAPLATAALTIMDTYVSRFGTVPGIARAWQWLGLLTTILLHSFLFAALFKLLPQARIQWRDVLIGALATGLMFSLGQYGIGVYLGYTGLRFAYGAAGSIVVLLVWVYYSTCIMFLGAELTHAYAKLTRLPSAPDQEVSRTPGYRDEANRRKTAEPLH